MSGNGNGGGQQGQNAGEVKEEEDDGGWGVESEDSKKAYQKRMRKFSEKSEWTNRPGTGPKQVQVQVSLATADYPRKGEGADVT
jgi:hypothetical protein